MEDKSIFQPTFGHLKTFSLFLVLDGFGGPEVSELVSRDFSDFMIKHETFMRLKDKGAVAIKSTRREKAWKLFQDEQIKSDKQ